VTLGLPFVAKAPYLKLIVSDHSNMYCEYRALRPQVDHKLDFSEPTNSGWVATVSAKFWLLCTSISCVALLNQLSMFCPRVNLWSSNFVMSSSRGSREQ
jgi:hypothetical protein